MAEEEFSNKNFTERPDTATSDKSLPIRPGSAVTNSRPQTAKNGQRPGSALFSIEEMYHHSKLIKNEYGIEEYEMPVHHQDGAKIKLQKELFARAISRKPRRKLGKIDKDAKRGGETEYINKHANDVPGPWSYDLKQKWMTGYRPQPGPSSPKNKRKMRFKWSNTPAENQNYEVPKKERQKKLDLSITKNTYIDDIFKKAQNKEYPLPGPGSHFLSDKLIKGKEDEELLKVPKKPIKKKSNCPLDKRKFCLSDLQAAAKYYPAANAYHPYDYWKRKEYPVDKREHKNINRKKHIEYEKERKQWNRERQDELKEYVETKQETMKTDLPKYPQPMPTNYVTFDKIHQKYPVNYKKRRPQTSHKGNGFGTQERFTKGETKKWKELVQRWNDGIGEGKQLDSAKDPQPGPASYSLIAYWPGKRVKGKRAKTAMPKGTQNHLKHVSKGPTFSVYHGK